MVSTTPQNDNDLLAEDVAQLAVYDNVEDSAEEAEPKRKIQSTLSSRRSSSNGGDTRNKQSRSASILAQKLAF